MLTIENEIYNDGYKYIACIDEVGRGCLAGDVVACAVIMPKGLLIDGVRDSKKLTAKKREKLYDIIIEKSIGVGIGCVDCKTIDDINIKKSTHLAMKKAIANIKDKEGKIIKPDFLLIDAETLDLNIHQKSVIKGDDKCHGIAAASIIAKVYRDKLCNEWAEKYQGYGLERNKGYGTREHRQALIEKGPTPIHRMSFLKNILKEDTQISFLED